MRVSFSPNARSLGSEKCPADGIVSVPGGSDTMVEDFVFYASANLIDGTEPYCVRETNRVVRAASAG